MSSLKPGHWPDPDMLPLGQPDTRQTAFTPTTSRVTILTLWSILPAPLIFGREITALRTTPGPPPCSRTTRCSPSTGILPASRPAHRAAGMTEVWARDLSLGRKAVALFNHDTQDATVSASFSQLGITSSPVAVRDVWQRMDVTGMTAGLSASVIAGSTGMYVAVAARFDRRGVARAAPADQPEKAGWSGQRRRSVSAGGHSGRFRGQGWSGRRNRDRRQHV